MLAALVALTLTAVAAAARAPAVPVTLDGAGPVTDLCRALNGQPRGPLSADPVKRAAMLDGVGSARDEALAGFYRVTIDAFAFRRYDPDGERLIVDTRWPLPAAGGWLALDLGRQELALAASPALAEKAYASWRDGQTRLVLSFELEDDAQCGGMELVAPRPLSVNAVSLWLEETGGVTLLRGADDLEAPFARSGEAAVQVDSVVVLAGHADPKKLTAALQGHDALKQCYAQGLVGRPLLRGSVVFQADIGRGGRPDRLAVALDDLHDRQVISCLHDTLSAIRLAGAESGTRLLVPIQLGKP
jgi:hypothetical protein